MARLISSVVRAMVAVLFSMTSAPNSENFLSIALTASGFSVVANLVGVMVSSLNLMNAFL